jgi:hypothetical protein
MGPDAIGHPDATPPPTQAACVLLRHDLPDGSWHYDLLMELRPGTQEDHRLAAVRLAPASPGQPSLTLAPEIKIDPSAPCERLPDHRGVYLTYEGPISGNRGHVRRVAQGRSVVTHATPDSLLVDLDLGRGWILLELSSKPPHHRWERGPAMP